MINDKWAIRLLKGRDDIIDSYVFKDDDMSASGFPNQNIIVGWVLRIIAIPNINQKVAAPISEAKEVELEKVPESEIKRPAAKGWVKEEGIVKGTKEELLRLKTQALEVKKRSAMEYESKQERAFNFMDLAKRELKQNNFDKAISFYNESQKIFDEINWFEGSRMTKESISAINMKILSQVGIEKIRNKPQLKLQITKAKDLYDLQQAQRRRELSAIQEEKEREMEIPDKAYTLLEAGAKLKDDKKFEEAFEKYLKGRNLFKKIGWEHEVSRINNDLMITLKKEKKQAENLDKKRIMILGKRNGLEVLLKEAEEKQKELDDIRKDEKKKQRVKLIQKERGKANQVIKNLKYNEGILALRKVIKKIENTDQDKLVKEMKKQIELLENASQVPIITNVDLDKDENLEKFKLAYQALDKAQISLSNKLFMKVITELKEAIYNLKENKIGIRFISAIEDKINTYKKELDIKKEPEVKKHSPKDDTDDLRARIARRREERRKRNEELEVKIGNKERILNLLKFNALTSKEIAKELNLSDKNTRTYLLRLKKEDKIKSVNKKGRFLIYTHQRPSIQRNQNNEIGSLREDLNYLLNLMELKLTPKDGVKFTPTDIMNIRKIEERIAYNLGGNLEGSQVVKDLIDFEQSFKEEINDKITKLEEKVDFITSRKVKSIKDEILEVKNGTTVLNIEGYLRKPDSVIKFLSDEKISTSKDLLVCNVCGAIFSYDYLYCSKCGNKLLKKQESKLIEIQKSVAPEEKIAIPIISNKLRGIKAKPKRFDRGSTRLKPIFSTRNDQVACEDCGYTIVKPFPKDELCPKCGKFLINFFKYVDNTDVESIKLEPKLFEPKTVTASSKIHGVRKKVKGKEDISLDHDVINLNGDNEYLKFCGITTVDRTQLFASNKKWLYFLELTNNLDFIATSILGGDLDKMLLKSENDVEEKCQFFEKNKLIYVIYGKFPDKKGKWVLEQMASHFSDLIRDKDVNNLSNFEKYDIENKFKGKLIFILKEYKQLQEVFSDQEIPFVGDWLRLDYVGLSSMSIGVISLLLDDEDKLDVKVSGEFEDPAEELEMKESLLTAKIEAIAANTLGNTGAYPRWIAVKLGFQNYRFLTFKKYKNGYFLSCLSEGNLKKIDIVEAQLELILSNSLNTPFSGNLRPFNKLKAHIKEFMRNVKGWQHF